MTDSTPHAVSARWVFADGEPPLAHGTVVLAEGRIADVTSRHVPGAVNLGNAAIIPGLVNAHVHLEFSDLEHPLGPARPFPNWIRTVIATRQNAAMTPTERIARGAAEVQRTGTAAVGEIATATESWDVLADRGDCGVVFQEALGLTPERRTQQWEQARSFLESHRGGESGLRPGLSPHAPYSVHPDLLADLVTLAESDDVPVAMHLAETEEELELLRTGDGPFRRMLEEFGIWPGDLWQNHRTVLEYLRQLDSVRRVLVVHGNYLTAAEIDYLADRPQFSVVYCPRTHAYFGHRPHPWQTLRERGIRVALGTDGRSSNPDLDLWQEVLTLRRQAPEVAPEVLLQMATAAGAEALGLASEVGRLAVGMPARLAAVTNLPEHETDPYAALLAPGTRARPLEEAITPRD